LNQLPAEILEYVADGECPACGAKNENVQVKSILEMGPNGQWAVTRREVDASIQTKYVKRTRGACDNCGAPEQYEHLHRTCLICQYNWSEDIKP